MFSSASRSSIVSIAMIGIFDPNHSRRRQELEAALGQAPEQILLSRRLAANGLAAYHIAKREGFEGIVAKDDDSVYEEAPPGNGSRSRFIRKRNLS
jgi:hypothetical protein